MEAKSLQGYDWKWENLGFNDNLNFERNSEDE